MSDKFYGEIDTYPWLAVTVEASYGTQEIKFLIDTGFDGEFAIPRSMMPLFGTSSDFLQLDFADGARESSMIVQCRAQWTEGYRMVTAIYIDGGNPLLGMELLENCLVTLEVESGQGQIIVEALQ